MYEKEDDRAGGRETMGKRECRAKGEKKIKGGSMATRLPRRKTMTITLTCLETVQYNINVPNMGRSLYTLLTSSTSQLL